MAKAVVFYFQVHQPYRTVPFDFFSIGSNKNYFESENHKLNTDIIKKVSANCYYPTNSLIKECIQKYPEIKLNFSLTGTVLEQLEEHAPDTIESFQELVSTNNIELLAETYYHSLAFLYSLDEFDEQISKHVKKIESLFNKTPKIFRNTELIYNDDLAKHIEQLGFQGILAEGTDEVISKYSVNKLYLAEKTKALNLFLKNYQLSDDIAFRFTNKKWQDWPLTASKFIDWIKQSSGDIVNIFLDYETFGEHFSADTGIHLFLKELLEGVAQSPDLNMVNLSEAIKVFPAMTKVSIPEITSWSDTERDLSAWLGNPLQQASYETLFKMREEVLKTNNPQLIQDWKRLTTSDHVYYMATKKNSDNLVHEYFSHYDTPYEAYNNFMNILHDLREKVYTY